MLSSFLDLLQGKGAGDGVAKDIEKAANKAIEQAMDAISVPVEDRVEILKRIDK